MKTRLINSIITLLLLTFSESNANITNDSLFTSPNENTELVQQFIDSLESLDTDYIVHVKKIDNSTNQTLYSNYILWAELFIKDTNKYGIKELDELEYDNGMISFKKTGSSRKLSYGKSLFRLLNTHQDTFFENDSFITIPIIQKTYCVIKVEIWNGGKTLKLEFPCELDFNSEYYSKLSGSLLYPIYLLIDREIASYIDMQDYYTRVYGDRKENYADELRNENYYNKKNLKYYSEFVERIYNEIRNEDIDTLSKEFDVYIPIQNWENLDSLFIDSLCRSGIDNMIIDYKGWYYGSYIDTTYTPSSSMTEIIWREKNSESIKVKFFGKFLVSPTYLLKSELFSFLDFNKRILHDSLMLNVWSRDLSDNNLWKAERNAFEMQKKDTNNFPISIEGEIIVYGDQIITRTSSHSGNESYHIFYNDFKTVFTTLHFLESNYKYMFKDYSERGYYSLELLIDKFNDYFNDEIRIYYQDCYSNKLNKVDACEFWSEEIKELEKYILDLQEELVRNEKELKDLQSENNSK